MSAGRSAVPSLEPPVADNRLLWSQRHELGPSSTVVVHRSDFGAPFGLGAYRWDAAPSGTGGLVWAFEGVVTIHQDDLRWCLTPQHAAWLPPGAATQVMANTPSRAVYVEWTGVPPGDRVRRVAVTGPAVDLLGDIAEGNDDPCLRELWPRVVAGLQPVHDEGLRVAIPTDPRGYEVVRAMMADPSDVRTLAAWARERHVSTRTLQRMFVRETGLAYRDWHTQMRLNASLPWLADGTPVREVARAVGYRSTVGFIDAFRGHFGVTPGRFFTS